LKKQKPQIEISPESFKTVKADIESQLIIMPIKRGAFVAAAVQQLIVAADEYFSGGLGVGVVVAEIGQLGVFGVIEQGPLEFGE
jgi:hypothetical protein